MQLVTMFVKGVPPIIFALFIGPWSDRFGRKFLIIFPLFGYVFYNVWFLINVIFFDTFVVEYLMLEVIQFWFGGFMCMFLGLYSYISDITDEKTRTIRIAILDFVFFTGMSIGSGTCKPYMRKYLHLPALEFNNMVVLFIFRCFGRNFGRIWLRSYLRFR